MSSLELQTGGFLIHGKEHAENEKQGGPFPGEEGM